MPDPFLDMATIARSYGVTIRTARRWAAADHWHRTISRPVRYSVADADASWRKRHGDEASAERIKRHLMRGFAIDSETRTGRPRAANSQTAPRPA